MNKKAISIFFIMVLILALTASGCSGGKEPIENKAETENFQKVEHIGQVPQTLKKVAERNEFKDIIAFDGRIMKAEICAKDEKGKTVTQTVRMMDVYGNEISSYSVSADDAYHIRTMMPTEDGGFLFVLGFEDYSYGDGSWASDKGVVSRVIKCDGSGKLQFDVPFNGTDGSAFRSCFEKDSRFFIFGEAETPETKSRGVYSETDIYMTVINGNGCVINSKTIAGSDYDTLNNAEVSGDLFLLSVSSQSDDGDFAGSNSKGYPVDWTITVNSDLEIVEKERESGRDYFDTRIGEKEGTPIYKSSDILKDFDAGTPTAYVDYGDFYLIVSENTTGIYENTPPMISSIWYCTETVYSGYGKSGDLIFRTSVDSSPDYDEMINQFFK